MVRPWRLAALSVVAAALSPAAAAPGSTSTTTVVQQTIVQQTEFIGNVARVDQVYGDDATAALSGKPFRTVAAALAAAVVGTLVWIAPGTYEENIVIPSGVAVRGMTTQGVIIQRTNVVAATDLVVMGEGSRLEDVTLRLTSSVHVTLRGVVFSGLTAATAKLRTAVVLVDNSAADPLGSSTVIGVHSNGTGLPSEEVQAIRATTVTVRSAGGGTKRGLLADTAVHNFSMRDVNFSVTRTGAPSGSYIAVETAAAGVAIVMRLMSLSGADADVSQTAGSITGGVMNLIHNTANSLPLNALRLAPFFVFGSEGAVTAGAVRYLRFGTSQESATEIKLRTSQKFVATGIRARAVIGPGAARVDTWILRVNGVNTPLAVTLTGAQTDNATTSVSVSINAGDDISLQQICAAGSTSSEVQVEVETAT